jgi:cell division protein FtsZ
MALVQPLPAQVAKIKVIGVGGGGGNAINHMADNEEIKGVDYVP